MKKLEIIKSLSSGPQDNLKRIKYFDRTSNATALILGKLLKENIDNKYWLKLGYNSFSDFMAQCGFSFTRRTAYNYIDLWGCFCDWKISYDDFVSVPYSKLLRIKGVVDETNLRDWLVKAEVLSRNDLELEIRELKGNEGMDDFKPIPRMFRCKEHGGWIIDVSINDCCPNWVKNFYDEAKKVLKL